MVISRLYNSTDIPEWDWQDFAPSEIACKCGCGRVLVHTQAMDSLQALRTKIGKPLRITSGYRCAKWNQQVGGVALSRHREGEAFDIDLAGHDRDELAAAALACGFKGIGKYNTFLHIDVRSIPASWSG